MVFRLFRRPQRAANSGVEDPLLKTSAVFNKGKKVYNLSRLRSVGSRRRYGQRTGTHALRIARVIRVFVLIRWKIAVACAGHVAARAGCLRTITARIVLGVQGCLVDVNNYALLFVGALTGIHCALTIGPKRFLQLNRRTLRDCVVRRCRGVLNTEDSLRSSMDESRRVTNPCWVVRVVVLLIRRVAIESSEEG